jgi:chromosomal replication initiator protein
MIEEAVIIKESVRGKLLKSLMESYVLELPKNDYVGDKRYSEFRIQDIVCGYFKVLPDEIKDRTRKREVLQIRQILIYFLKQYTRLSLNKIGAFVSLSDVRPFDHATCLHAIRTINNIISTEKEFKKQIEEIDKQIKK